MRWIRRFLTSDDPIVKLIGALSEPEALMRRELLENKGVPAMVKDAGVGIGLYGARAPFAFELHVRQSDADEAAEILGPLMDASPADDDSSKDHR